MTANIKTLIISTALIGCIFSQVVQGRTFKVAAEYDANREIIQDEILSRFEDELQSIDTVAPTKDDFKKALEINGFIGPRSEFPTDELVQKAEDLTQILNKFFARNPEYTDILKDEILRIQRLKEANETTTYSDDMSWQFRLVQYVPTPEIVIMLGSLLEYDDGFYVDGRLTKAIHNGNASLAGRSIRTLLKFPLIDGPERPPPSHPAWYDSDMIAPEWQAWWQEIVDGERVFQLEGDPTRYNHLGPVSADWKPRSASRATAMPSTQIPSRTPPPRTTPSPEIKAQENRFLWASLALVVIALLAWAKTRFQKKRTKSFL